MKLSPFLAVTAILHALFGAAALLIPDTMAGLLGISFDAVGIVLARVLGSTLLGFAAALWWSRSLVAAEILKGVLIGGFTLNVLSAIAGVMAISGGVLESRAWAGIAIRLALAAGFGYFAFFKEATPVK